MSSPFVIPFNFEPVAISIKTSSYVIPAGKYAQVYVECNSGGAFLINGIVAIQTSPLLAVDVYTTSTGALSYSVPANYSFEGIVVSESSNSDLTIAGNQAGILNADSQNQVNAGPGQTIAVVYTGGATSRSITGVSTPSNGTSKSATFWIPSGTTINGSGDWKATVMEFNRIT